jgi:phage gpG-like protein
MAATNPQVVYFEVTGEKDVALEMRGMGARAMNATPVLEAISHLFAEYEAAQFATEGFGEWEPLAASTLASKARKGYPSDILVATGILRSSLTEDGLGSERRVTPNELVFGTRVPYAQYHAFGTSKMPQRNPVKVREDVMRAATKLIQRYIMGLERGAFPMTSGPTSLDPFGLKGG